MILPDSPITLHVRLSKGSPVPLSIAPMLALQVAATAIPPPAPTPVARIDLLRTGPAPCVGDGEDVVVCGRRDPDRYRLRPLPDQADTTLPRAETRLFGNVRGAATVEQQAMPNGMTSKRLMLGLKLPF